MSRDLIEAQQPCKEVSLLLGAHLDGQLDAVRTLEVENHIGACELCRERLALDRALRGSLKKAVKTTAPDDVRARMLAAMAGESARQSIRESGSDLAAETDAHVPARHVVPNEEPPIDRAGGA